MLVGLRYFANNIENRLKNCNPTDLGKFKTLTKKCKVIFKLDPSQSELVETHFEDGNLLWVVNKVGYDMYNAGNDVVVSLQKIVGPGARAVSHLLGSGH